MSLALFPDSSTHVLANHPHDINIKRTQLKPKVKVKHYANEYVYEIVGFSQSDPSNGKISDESPVGKALIGASIGEKVTVEAPIGMLEFEIKAID